MATESPRNMPSVAPSPALAPTTPQGTSDESPALAPTTPKGASDDLIGLVVDGRYRIKRRLGEGGMGAVYVAEHLSLRKDVAFKVIHADFSDDREIATRFAREASASARLDHPHVATVVDYGTLPSGAAFMVMQLVRGRSLREELDASGALEWKSAVEVAAQVADAMVAAHEAGIIHRDLKPDNILLEHRADGTFLAKVLDFGIARVQLEGTELEGAAPEVALTRLGTVVGTPGYMAPEQAMGETVDERADLYSLGVILWEMLSGKRLFPESDLSAIVTRQLTGGSPLLETPQDRPMPPGEVGTLVQSILEPQPARRPRTAREVRDALRALAYAAPTKFRNEAVESPDRPFRPSSRQLWSGAIGVGLGVVATLLTSGLFIQTESTARTLTKIVASRIPSIPVVSDEATEKIQELLHGADRASRRRAASWIASHPEGIPTYAREVARLETARRCTEQQDAIESLVDINDPRSLIAIERFATSPTRGCGFLGLGDCYRCVRPIARDALKRFESVASE